MQPQDYFSLEDFEKRTLIAQVFQAVGAHQLQDFEIRPSPDDDETVEMRGSHHGYPTRLTADLDSCQPKCELKATNPAGRWITLSLDPDDIPRDSAFSGANAAWDGDGDDDVKLFFGRGLSINGDQSNGDADAAVYLALPVELRTSVAQITAQDQIHLIDIDEDGKLELQWNRALWEINFDAVLVARGVWLLGQLAWGLSQLQPGSYPAPGEGATPSMFQRAKCARCASHFAAGYTHCPNCLAPQ